MESREIQRRMLSLGSVLACAAAFACGPPVETAEILPALELTPVNGTELFVTRLGEGEPIIVVHGGPMLEHGYLLPHLEPLAETHELILYDQRLSGRSAPQADSASIRLQTYVDDIEALRVNLGLERVHLMAHSWGGLLAMNYAIRYGENLRSLILLDPVGPSAELSQQEQEALAEFITDADRQEMQTIRETEAFAERRPEAIAELLRTSFRSQFHDRSLINALHIYVPEDYVYRSRQFGYMAADLVGMDIRNALAGVEVPTLVVYGATEPGAEIGGAALHEHLPESELVIIENSGHFPFIERPDTLFPTVLEFLGRNH